MRSLDTIKNALKTASTIRPLHYKQGGSVDPKTQHIDDWKWRPLKQVQGDLDLHEIPSHVEKFGSFMDDTARRAEMHGLTPRDLIKAYTITRSSIQRGAVDSDKVRKAGLILPPSVTGKIRQIGDDKRKNVLFLETPADLKMPIECMFQSPDALTGFNVGDEVVVTGECEPRMRKNEPIRLTSPSIIKK